MMRTCLLLLFSLLPALAAIKCYSCANDFVVWQWRHLFLKRNYGLSQSDAECGTAPPESPVVCHSTCFMLFLNATDKRTGRTRNLGVGRGCSSQFLSDEQHMHLGLGAHSKASEVGQYLPHDFDQMEIHEHWCFCASDFCNTQNCYSTYRSLYGGREHNSFIAKRIAYQNQHSYWRFNAAPALSLLPLLPLVALLLQ